MQRHTHLCVHSKSWPVSVSTCKQKNFQYAKDLGNPYMGSLDFPRAKSTSFQAPLKPVKSTGGSGGGG